ncbi:flippase [Thermophilibacter sp.]
MTSLKINFLYNVAYQLLTIALPLVTAPYLSRVLGPEGMGTYSYTYSVAYYFVLFAMLGVNNYGTRAVASARDDEGDLRMTFWSIWALQAILALLCSALYIGYSFVAGDAVLSLLWVPYVISAALDVNWLFFGLERFKVTVVRNFAVKLATFVLTFVIVRGENALEHYLILMSVSFFASAAMLWPFVLREVKPCLPGGREVLSHLKPNLVLFVPVIAVSLYTVLDKVMLGQMAGMSESGIFENSLKIAQVPFSLITALGTVMLPHAANLFASGKTEEGKRYIAPSMWFALLLSSAFTFGLIAITPEFVPVFFGERFSTCAVVMPVIVLEMPFMAWANVIRTQYLIPARNDRAYVASVIVGAILNVVVNVCLIPRLGALGAGIGTLAAEISVCLIQTAAVAGRLPIARYLAESVPGFAIGLIMLMIVRGFATVLLGGVLGLVLEIAVGAAAFAAIASAWFAVSKNQYAEELLCPLVRKLARGLCRK